MLSGGDMSNTERFVRQSFALIAASLALWLVRDYLRLRREVESERIVEDVELFLKAQRLQDLILPDQQEIIDRLGKEWIGDSYRGLIKSFNWRDVLKQQLEKP